MDYHPLVIALAGLLLTNAISVIAIVFYRDRLRKSNLVAEKSVQAKKDMSLLVLHVKLSLERLLRTYNGLPVSPDLDAKSHVQILINCIDEFESEFPYFGQKRVWAFGLDNIVEGEIKKAISEKRTRKNSAIAEDKMKQWLSGK